MDPRFQLSKKDEDMYEALRSPENHTFKSKIFMVTVLIKKEGKQKKPDQSFAEVIL